MLCSPRFPIFAHPSAIISRFLDVWLSAGRSGRSLSRKEPILEHSGVIIFVGLLVFLAHFFVALFERTKVPDVLYLILIGLIIGPILGIVKPEDFGKVGPIFTTIALVVILFEGGLELNIDNLRSSFRRTVIMTVLSYFVAMILLSSAVFLLTELTVLPSVFVGAVLAAPAPAVMIPMARQLNLKGHARTILTLESSLGEALGIVVALAVVELIRLSDIRVGRLIGTLLSTFLFALIIGALGGYTWSILLHRMRELRYAIFTTPAFVFIVYGVAEFLGFSGPVAALTCGVVLGNSEIIKLPKFLRMTVLKPLQHNETEKMFFGEIVFLVKTFFFVFLGLTFRFTDPISLAASIAFTLVLLLSRLIATQHSLDRSQTPLSDASTLAVMVPKGTAAAVLASIPLQLGLQGGIDMQNVVYGVVVVSIVFTAVLIPLIEKTPVGKLYEFFLPMYKKNLPAIKQESTG